ncbi:uncharacterized protein LOC115562282 [Drosophila navojoa]|nr:uncharacterized protein LOC115562282 [Drosophila navojoa]
MVASSSLFAEQISWRNCNELLHPHSCRRAAWQHVYRFVWSNLKYYLPMFVLDLLKQALRGNQQLLHSLRNAMWYYGQLVFGGLVTGWLSASFICLLRHLLGEFRPNTVVFLPAVLAGAFDALLPIRVKQVHHTALFQALIESLLLQRSNPLTKALGTSLWRQTLLFMACSAVIMLGKQREWHKGFWFVAPDCLQSLKSLSPIQYVVQGVRKYLLIGLALDIFKGLISCIKTSRWHLKQFSLESMAWLGCYVGIYRTSLCYMASRTDVSQTLQQIVSSFLGGLSFVCYPKLTILSYALLEAGRSLWGKYRRKRHRSRFGYSELVFPLVLAYLIHTYAFYPKRVSALASIIIDSTTGNYAGNISRRLQHLQPAGWHGKWI